MQGKDSLKQGMIMKVISGFYYVEIENKLYECKIRGTLKQQIQAVPGDEVTINISENGINTIEKVYERKSFLRRPSVANLDNLLIVASTCDPTPNLLNIDKMIALAIKNDIRPILIISKSDLQSPDKLIDIYKQAGIDVYSFSLYSKENTKKISKLTSNKISALCGNSGVGKSSLLNSIFPHFKLKTDETSKKLGRGKHTTREVELFKISPCTYIADSPGFSTIDLAKNGIEDKNEIQNLFPEFSRYLGKCKFSSCSHTCEKGCRIIKALQDDEINKNRHDSYINMYKELEGLKKW